jgi:hypothetical protein
MNKWLESVKGMFRWFFFESSRRGPTLKGSRGDKMRQVIKEDREENV